MHTSTTLTHRPTMPPIAIAATHPTVHLAALSDRIAALWRRSPRTPRVHKNHR